VTGAGTDHPGQMSAGSLLDAPAKFAAPVATHVVARQRLHERLTEGLECPITLIAATAGWGKTLLAGSWVAAGAGGRASAWISLDPGDDDERTFWRAAATALMPVAGAAAADDLRRMASADAGAHDLPGEFAAAMRQADRPVVLVLDNLHEVNSKDVHAGLLRLIERPLPSLSLLATTRRDPPWPLQRLRLAGLLTEVRDADLAFRSDETEALFAQLRVDLTAEQLERLAERTEGWAAGLRLAALHMRGSEDVDAAVRTFSGNDHSVAGYLLGEVLDRQSPELSAFLERISMVDLVCADLADALTGGHDGAAMLAELAASHLFVQAIGRPGQWYRLHRLIVDILRARPIPARKRRDLHRRAAEWFRDNGMPLAAVRSAVRGEVWPLAADLIGTNLVRLALRGDARELERLLAGVSRAVLLGRPELATGLAGARVALGIGSEVSALLEAVRSRAGELPGRRAERVRVLADLIAATRARVAGDFDESAVAYRRVPLDLGALSGLGLRDVELIPAVVLSNLGVAELWGGDLRLAERHLLAGADTAGRAPALPRVNATAHLALLHVEAGELDAAEATAREIVTMAAGAGWTRTAQVVPAYLAMARIVHDRDEPDSADDWLERVAEVEAVAPEPHVRLAAALILAGRREAAGDPGRALAGLRETAEQLRSWTPPQALAEQWLLTEALLLGRSGDATPAQALLDQVGPPRTAAGTVAAARLRLLLGDTDRAETTLAGGNVGSSPRGRVGAGIVGALAAKAAGNPDRALERIEHALLAAAPGRLRRPFLADSNDLRDLLGRRVERGTAVTAFAVDLLQRQSSAPTDELAARRALVDPLTERERTILHYLASTLSNTEIAAELYVSINTVKTHQRTVYRKLAADGRRDAVRRARSLHLL
jgi:LuxR family maltose regulon positive regulatory protein